MKPFSLVVVAGVLLVAPLVGFSAAESKADEVVCTLDDKSLKVQVVTETGPLLTSPDVSLALGRDFSKQDFEKKAPAVAILSFGVWQAATDGRPGILGRTLKVGDREYLVVGVTKKSPPPEHGLKVWLAVK